MKRIKSFENKLKFLCSNCLATYTLLEIHFTNKELTKCLINCNNIWQEQLFKYCQEKVLRNELEQDKKENKQDFLADFLTTKHK